MADMQSITYLEGAEHAAVDLRLVHLSLIGVPGIASPEALQVTETPGTPDMAVRVAAGGVWLGGSQASDQGVYHAQLTSAATLPVAPADSTNARIDLVVARVRDQFYAGSEDRAEVAIVTGTTAAVPAEPAVPANSEVLARINVPAGATAIANAQLVDRRVSAKLRGSLLAGADLGTFTPTQDGHLVTRAHMRDYVGSGTYLPYSVRDRNPGGANTSIPNNTETAPALQRQLEQDRQGAFTEDATTVTFFRPGLYRVEFGVRWSGNASGERVLVIVTDGAAVAGARQTPPSANPFDQQVTRTVRVTASRVLTCRVLQTSGGALDVVASDRTYRVVTFVRD